MKKDSVGKNYVFYTIYQVLMILLPLITTPYISRVLLPEGIGLISYTNSISNYIVLIVSFGTGIYANRKIAFLQDNYEEQNKIFWEILLIRFISVTGGIVLYGYFIFTSKNKILMLIQGIYIIAEYFNVDWLFTGNESFRSTVARGIIVKLLGIISIFLFVKTVDDIKIYAFILAISVLGGNLSLWFYMPKYIVPVKVKLGNCWEHILGSLTLFIPQLAGSIYLYVDKIMLGLMTTSTIYSGYYEQSQKIVRLSLTIVTSLSAVMLPRTANAYAKGKHEDVKRYLNFSLHFLTFLGIPMVLGLCAIADNLIPWFMGSQYQKVALLLKILSPIIFLNGLYNMVGCQYFLATKKEMIFTLTVVAGAGVNLLLNWMLIPVYYDLGAVIGSVFAEATVSLLQLFYIRKIIDIKYFLRSLVKNGVGGGVMFLILYCLEKQLPPELWATLILVLCGGVLYIGIEFYLKDELLLLVLKNVKTRYIYVRKKKN